MFYTIKGGGLTAVITDAGAQLISLRDKFGKEIMWTPTPGYWLNVATVLFPVCGALLNQEYTYEGKIYPMTGHGFAHSRFFKMTSLSDSAVTFELKASLDTKEIYPFDFTLQATYSLGEDGFSAVFTVKNDGDDTLPYMFGWHPGFALEECDYKDYYLDFGKNTELAVHRLNGPFANPKSEPFPLDNGIWRIDTARIYCNDTIILDGANGYCALCRDGVSRKIELFWSDNIPVFCVWKWADDNARYICLEPWTGMSNDGKTKEDFATRKMERLLPGEDEKYEYKIKITY